MLKIILVITAALGLLMALLSKFQNLFLFFFGLGTLIASLFSLRNKNFSRYLFIPFIIFLGSILFFFNSINFKPNSFEVDFFNSTDFNNYLLINYGSTDSRELIVYPLKAMPDLGLDQANQISFVLNKHPILTSDDLILTDYSIKNQNAECTWYWSGDSKWKQIIESQYLHIFDPNQNIYYPNAINAFNLVNNLNFILVDSTPENNQIFNEIPLNDVYYQTQPSYFNFNSPIESILLQEQSLDEFVNYNVYINGIILEQESFDNGLHKYSFDDPVKKIEEIKIVESRSSTSPLNIEAIQPPNLSLYVLESNPKPIIIEKISLFKYLGRINYFLPFFDWDASKIHSDFSVKMGDIYVENDLLYIIPEGISTTIKFNHSPIDIIQLSSERIKPYSLLTNSLITVFLVIVYAGVTIFLNKNWGILQKTFRNMLAWFKHKFIPFFHNLNLGPVTPHKIFFSMFLFLSWILILIPIDVSWLRSILIGITLILSALLVYYIIRNHEIENL